MSENFDEHVQVAIDCQHCDVDEVADLAASLQAEKAGGAHALNILLAWRALQERTNAYAAWDLFIDAMLSKKRRYKVDDTDFLNFTWFGVIARCFTCSSVLAKEDFGEFMRLYPGLYRKELLPDMFSMCKDGV